MINTIGLRSGLFVLGVTVSLIALASLGALKRIDTVALAPEGLELIRSVPLLRRCLNGGSSASLAVPSRSRWRPAKRCSKPGTAATGSS